MVFGITNELSNRLIIWWNVIFYILQLNRPTSACRTASYNKHRLLALRLVIIRVCVQFSRPNPTAIFFFANIHRHHTVIIMVYLSSVIVEYRTIDNKQKNYCLVDEDCTMIEEFLNHSNTYITIYFFFFPKTLKFIWNAIDEHDTFLNPLLRMFVKKWLWYGRWLPAHYTSLNIKTVIYLFDCVLAWMCDSHREPLFCVYTCVYSTYIYVYIYWYACAQVSECMCICVHLFLCMCICVLPI